MREFFLFIVSCVFAKTWNCYTSIGIEPFAKDSVLYLSFGKFKESVFYFNHNHIDCLIDMLTIKLYKFIYIII